ncbi:MAG: YvcK family protein [Candidatus Moraniibacteriota bacterium]|nr:MAG: YvcK family protein [Candidatus Moranbacteria bacterium]
MKKVVTIGGGTGSFMLLSGLKEYPIELSAIVSMADDGGSTGVLRDELGVLPPGDVRQCLVALSDTPERLRELMNYRFENGGLEGHNFGNLLLSALEKITGDFGDGVREAAQILNVRGEVIPVTLSDTRLYMELVDGRRLSGEHEINTDTKFERVGVKRVSLKPVPRANPLAVERILAADLIVIGPGSHYCAIIPSLIVPGIAEALRKTRAKVVYNCNLVSKHGQTDRFALEDYVDALHTLIGKPRIDFVTYNTSRPTERLLKKYAHEGSIVPFRQDDPKRRYRVIQTDLLSQEKVRRRRADKIAHTRAFIRHDPKKLARVLMLLLEIGEYENILNDIV